MGLGAELYLNINIYKDVLMFQYFSFLTTLLILQYNHKKSRVSDKNKFIDYLLNLVNWIYMFISATSQNSPKIIIKDEKNGRGEDNE